MLIVILTLSALFIFSQSAFAGPAEDACNGYIGSEYTECLTRYAETTAEASSTSEAFTPAESSIATDEKCGDVDVAISVGCDNDESINPIYAYATAFINFLAAGVGLVVVTMVAVGGVQYMTAGGNPQNTEAAIKRIANALIGLVLFIFLWAFLSWLIPGGLFSSSGSSSSSSDHSSIPEGIE